MGRKNEKNVKQVGEEVSRQAHNLKIGGSIPSSANLFNN